MIKILLLASALLLLSCSDKLEQNPMLWEIKGKGLKATSYLFGTFHTRDKVINLIPNIVSNSIKKSRRFYSEIKMNKKSEMQIIRYSKLANPIALRKRLDPKTIMLIERYIKNIGSKINLKQLSRFKTWAIPLILSSQEDSIKYPNRKFMDEKLIDIAKKFKVKLAGLESIQEQLQHFEELSKKEQELLNVFSIKEMMDIKHKKSLVAWYKKGNIEGFFEIQNKFISKNPGFKELAKKLNIGLLEKRNKIFTRRINILLQDKPHFSYFFALGAGHLVGKSGILEQLKLLGYKVKKVNN